MNPEYPAAKISILVIDDDSDVRESTVRILEKAGFCVVSGTSSAEAISLTRQHRPALVLLDVVLPDASGVDTALTLKKDPALSGVFIILISGMRISPEAQAEGLSKGLADGYICRPFSQAEFLARIDAFLRIRATQEALLESKYFLQTTLDSLSASIALLDEQGSILFVNKAWRDFAEQNGLPAETVSEESNYLEVCNRANGCNMEEAKPFADGIRNVLSGAAEYFELEYPCHSSCKNRWFIGRVTRFPGDGPGRVVVSHENITGRKQAEEALESEHTLLRNLIDNVPDRIYAKDSEGRFIICNVALARRMGMDSPTEIVGKSDFDFLPREMAQRFRTDEHTIIQSGIPMINREEPLTTEGGTITRWNLATKVPLLDKQGNRIGIVGVGREITDRKRAEVEKAELEAQNQQLQKAESLGRMAGAIAHHFNNQLYVVMGNLEMAMDDLPRGADISETLAEAQKAAHKAAEVSKVMLTYLGQASGNQEPIDLSETCRQSLTLLQAATPKGIIINAEFPSSGPVIRADTNQIHQILTNLITNAWESITVNRGTIGLTVKTVSHADISTSKRFPIDWQPQSISYAGLEVSDTGSGIANKDIEKIFDPFFTTKFTGRGLGLPVVMGIVKAHNGEVTVESEQGRGSVFRIFLPVSTEELPIQHDLPVMSEALRTGKTEKISKIEGGGTVLLIEDEEQVRKMAKIMLTRLGYTVLEAKDGVEAMEIFQQHQDKIRCVLSDLAMPRMDGWETLVALRKLSPDIPVVLSSGYDEAQVMAGNHIEQPNAFLGKPYRSKDLSETISSILAKEPTQSSLVKLVEEVASLQSF